MLRGPTYGDRVRFPKEDLMTFALNIFNFAVFPNQEIERFTFHIAPFFVIIFSSLPSAARVSSIFSLSERGVADSSANSLAVNEGYLVNKNSGVLAYSAFTASG